MTVRRLYPALSILLVATGMLLPSAAGLPDDVDPTWDRPHTPLDSHIQDLVAHVKLVDVIEHADRTAAACRESVPGSYDPHCPLLGPITPAVCPLLSTDMTKWSVPELLSRCGLGESDDPLIPLP